MAEQLTSLGLDVGTTSTQMVFSRLTIENQASSFAVPQMEISQRKILYQSPVYFTPLLDESRVDGDGLRKIVETEYRSAGISRQQVDTGAIIITGETSRKDNARAVLQALADFAGEFVVATAGPDLESVLAAKGAGAAAYSEESGKTVLHMDIGGGTSNLALIRDGKILDTGCLNVGGRLIKMDKTGQISYVSPVLRDICDLHVGDMVTKARLETVAHTLAGVLEMAASLREETSLLSHFTTPGTQPLPFGGLADGVVVSFSGGVADCIGHTVPWLEYGDMGPVLGQAIRQSRLCQGEYILGSETIRATVIGAGCHSAQLSGSTVFYQNMTFPLKNIPVINLTAQQQEDSLADTLRRELDKQEGIAVIALPGLTAPGYREVAALAQQLTEGFRDGSLLVCLEQDMAKALGQALAARMPRDSRILCLDRVKIPEGSYLDVAAPVGPALPVVVKTLILER